MGSDIEALNAALKDYARRLANAKEEIKLKDQVIRDQIKIINGSYQQEENLQKEILRLKIN